MANLNKVLLMGNLTREPQSKALQQNGTPICDLGMAVNRRYKTQSGEEREDVVYVDLTAYGYQADFCAKNMTKGSTVYVEGHLRYDSWQDKESGKTRSKLRVIVDTILHLEKRNAELIEPQAYPSMGYGQQPPYSAPAYGQSMPAYGYQPPPPYPPAQQPYQPLPQQPYQRQQPYQPLRQQPQQVAQPPAPQQPQATPQQSAPQPAPQQQATPQQSAPQQPAPQQQATPQQSAPQPAPQQQATPQQSAPQKPAAQPQANPPPAQPPPPQPSQSAPPSAAADEEVVDDMPF